jgi:tetratricopeptide (TPR) repeat protein
MHYDSIIEVDLTHWILMKRTYRAYLSMGILGCLLSGTCLGANTLPGILSTNDPQQNALNAIMLGEIAADQHQPDLARQYYQTAAQFNSDSNIAKRALFFALSEKRTDLSIQAAQQWATVAPKNIDAQLIALDLLLKNNQAQAAVPYLQAALSYKDKDVLASILNEIQQLPRAAQVDLLQALSELTPSKQNKLPTLAVMSLLQYQTDQPNAALETINRILDAQPDWGQAIALKAEYLINSDQMAAAEDFTRAKATQYPSHPFIQLINAEVLLKGDKTAEATKKLEQLQKFPETRGVALLTLAQLALEQKQLITAQHYLNSATEDPNQANTAYFLLGEVYEFQHNPDKALEAYNQVQDGDNYLTAQFKVVSILTHQGKFNDALEQLNNIDVENAAEAKRVVLLQTELLIKLQRNKTAMEVLDRAITAMPNDIQLLFARSVIADHMHQADIAEQDLKKIILINPNQAAALNALGYLLTDNSTRYPEALNYIQRALALEPNNPVILDSMGWLQYRMGNLQTAYDYLQRAYKLGDNSVISAHYSTILWKMGKKPDAKKILESALQKFPNDPNLLNTMQSFTLKDN